MARSSYDIIVRLGLIHIPGSMGSSIGSAIAESLNVRYLPIHGVVSDIDVVSNDRFMLKVPSSLDSLTRDVLLSYPLIAGHLSVGQIQATYRTHIITVVTEPRQRLIKLFAHHAAPGLFFSDWLTERVDYQSDLISCFVHGTPIPPSAEWFELHARSHRKVTNPTFRYAPKLVETVVSPIDHIFFASNPQFVLDFLFDKSLLLRPTTVQKLNRRDPRRKIDWGNLESGFEILKHVTINDYRFIDQMSSRAQIDPTFEIWDDARTLQFLKETAETD